MVVPDSALPEFSASGMFSVVFRRFLESATKVWSVERCWKTRPATTESAPWIANSATGVATSDSPKTETNRVCLKHFVKLFQIHLIEHMRTHMCIYIYIYRISK